MNLPDRRSRLAVAALSLCVWVPCSHAHDLFMMNSNHTDYNSNASWSVYDQAMLHELDYHLGLIASTTADSAVPFEEQARYALDNWWWLYLYEAHRSPEQFQRLIEAMRSEHITVPLNPFVTLYGALPTEAAVRAGYYPGRISRQYDVQFRMAEAMENRTIPWGVSSIWAGSGVNYTWKGVCPCPAESNAPNRQDDELFIWEGPDGKTMPFKWYELLFDEHDWGGYAEARDNLTASAIQQEIERTFVRMPGISSTALFGAGGEDVSWENTFVLDAIESYNDTATSHRAISSNGIDFFQSLEASGDVTQLDVLRGGWGNDWDMWPASLAERTARTRRALERLRMAELLASLAQVHDTTFWAPVREELEDGLFSLWKYYEHSWATTAGGPTIAQLQADKEAWSEDFDSAVNGALAAAETAVSGLFSTPHENRVAVFNPLGFTRRDVADVKVSDPGPWVVHDVATGQGVPSQLYTRDGVQYLRFLATDVPSLGYRVYRYAHGTPPALPDAAAVDTGLRTISGNRYRVMLGEQGQLVELTDLVNVRQLAGASGLNAFGSGSIVSVTTENVGPVSATLRVELAGIARTVRVTLFTSIDRVDVENTITQAVDDTTRFYSFHVNLPQADILFEEVGAIARPGLEREGGNFMQGTRASRMTLNHFVDFSLEDYHLVVSNRDAFAMQVNDSTDTAFDLDGDTIHVVALERQAGAGIANQGGEDHFTFRFALRGIAAPYHSAQALRSSLSHQNPFHVVPLPSDQTGPLTSALGSLVSVDTDEVVVTALKPAEDPGAGFIVRAWALGSGPVDFSIDASGMRAHAAWRASLIETDQATAPLTKSRITAHAAANELVTYRFTVHPLTELDLDGDGYTPSMGDCNDADEASFPGAVEYCDGNDNACLGSAPLDEQDLDGDLYVSCVEGWLDTQGDDPHILGEGDCADADATVFPGAPELCDGIDNDCNDAIDDGAAGQSCDNGLHCDGIETCDLVGGNCLPGTAPAVDDGVACTLDSCDETSDVIVHQPSDLICDDTLFCNGVETCDPVNDCQAGTAPCEAGRLCNDSFDICGDCLSDTDCDNGQFCDGPESCDVASGTCLLGTAPVVDDGVACTLDSCDEANDVIVHLPSNLFCDDTLFCNGAEICDPVGGCLPDTPPIVDDGVTCTVDSCDEASDIIVHEPSDLSCDDTLFCNGVETCDPALGCQPGTAPPVDDGVGCTLDSCNEVSDIIVHQPSDLSCDDTLFCNGVETCDPVDDCQAGTAPCEAGQLCNDSFDICGDCLSDTDCDNGQFCDGPEPCDVASGACLPGTAPIVDDGVTCTLDSCDEASDVIVHQPSDLSCDDTLFCNGTETCDLVAGCQPGTAPAVDDGVGCTLDSCNEVSDIIVHQPNDFSCDDTLFCNGVETCDPVDDCQPGTMPCEAGQLCNDSFDICGNCLSDTDCDNGQFCDGPESCDVASGACLPGTAPIVDDGVTCTLDSCDEASDVIVHQPSDLSCDDTLFCNGTETCDLVAGCQPGTAPTVDDGVTCTLDSCDEASDVIVHQPSDLSCDDTLFCNGTETCDLVAGCQPGTAPTVDDGVTCTVDSCDEASDIIVHEPSDLICDDTLFCNGVETCDPVSDCQAGTMPCEAGQLCNDSFDICGNCLSDTDCDNGQFCDGPESCDVASGACLPGTAPVVDDGVTCTVDSCDEANDIIVHQPSDLSCDDTLFCNGTETCDLVAGCQLGTAPAVDDGVTCTVDSCDETNDVIVHQPSDLSCDDTLFCSGTETCDPALGCQPGTAPAVDDGVTCTVDSCDETNDVIVHQPSDLACDDTLFCNGAEICDPVADCLPGTAPIVDDGVTCTVDSCDETNDVIVHLPSDLSCDDTLFCNGAEICDPVADCQPGTAPVVDDDVACTLDSCDENNDIIVHQPSDLICDDTLFCNGTETCDLVAGCQLGTAPAVDDGVACTVDSCDETNDVIVHQPSDLACDDTLFCNGAEICDPVADCQPGTAPSVDDGVTCTVDSCDEASDVIVHQPSDLICDDTLFCNGAETCDLVAGCQPGTAPTVDDGVTCTVDSCDETSDVIVHQPSDLICDDTLFCNGTETCDLVAGCQPGTAPSVDDGVTCTVDSCDEANDVIVHQPSGLFCDDTLFCNGAEICDPVADCQPGTAPVVDDDVTCTVDSCDEANDILVHQPSDLICDDTLFCNGVESCDPVGGCLPGTAPVVDDDVTCTLDSCDEANDVIVHLPSDFSCDDTLFCNGAETCDPVADCQPGTAPAVDDGVGCTLDSCDESSDVIVHQPSDPTCDDTLFCNGAEICDPVADCQPGTAPAVDDGVTCTLDSCDEASDVIVHQPSDLICDDTLFCNGTETCDLVASCQPGVPPCKGVACDEAQDACAGTTDPNVAHFSTNRDQFASGIGKLHHEDIYAISPLGGPIGPGLESFLTSYLGLNDIEMESDGTVLFTVNATGILQTNAGPQVLVRNRIYRYDPQSESITLAQAWPPQVIGITGTDALARSSDGRLLFSTSIGNLVLHGGGFSFLRHEDVYSYDPATNVIELFLDGSELGLASLDAVDVLEDGRIAFSVATPQLVTMSSTSVTVRESDVLAYDPVAQRFSLLIDGEGLGLATLDAVTLKTVAGGP